ncbi:kinase-like protein [Trametes cingulata]|nr:kinase-like protein [Trametes cingulata]
MSVHVAISELIGHVVEQYKLVERIHVGNHGVVYRAINMFAPSSSCGRDRRSDRAIKVIPKSSSVQSCLEIDLHNVMSDHPNVITMEDAFEDEDYYFLVLELCPGGDLFTKIWNERVYQNNDELVRSTFVQILDAVQACHAANVYHRDLKPQNILCNKDGSEVYLCDFGMGECRWISREFGSGTLNYMSPECLGDDIGRRPYSNIHHDIWALGVVLVNLITASYPWTKATTADDDFSDYLHDPEFLLDKFDISEGANDILRKMFVLNPMGRINLPELRAAILDLHSFFRPSRVPTDQADESEDINDVEFPLCVVEEEELIKDIDEFYIFPSADRNCTPVKPIEQPLDLDFKSIDAIVRSFGVDTDLNESPVCSRSSSASSISSDDSDDWDSDEDDDSDGPVTPPAIIPGYDIAGAEVNVYEGIFMEELRERIVALPKLSETSTKAAPSPRAQDSFAMEDSVAVGLA